MHLPSVSIVFPNFNGQKDCLAFIDSILASTYPQNKIEIIMVDNNSTDGSVETVRNHYPSVKVINLNDNVGPGQARNKGVGAAKGELIFLADNDQIFEKETLTKMIIEMLEHPEIAILGPRINHKRPAQKLISCGYQWNPWLGVESGTLNPDLSKEVDWLAGCAILVRKEVLKKIGLFDPRFFFYAEDADLCLRAREQGFHVCYTPQASIHHDRSTPSVFNQKYDYSEYYFAKFLLILKHANWPQKMTSLSLHLFVFPWVRLLKKKPEFPLLKLAVFVKAMKSCYG